MLNPANGEVLAQVPLSGRPDVDVAVAAAREAFPAWRSRSTIERARWLFGLREALNARADELARRVTTEMGKTFPDARAEVSRMVEMVEAAAAIPTTMQGRNLENVATAIDCETYRQPVGVVRGHRPVQLPGHGAHVVPAVRHRVRQHLHPQADASRCRSRSEPVFEIIDGLDLPPGVVNLVNGGAGRRQRLLEHPGIDAISFVGSADRPLRLREAGAARQARPGAGGAKNFMVVMPDAIVDKTASNIIGSAFGAAGRAAWRGRC